MQITRLLTSCGGLGWLPLAPGTWGSLPPAIIFGLMLQYDCRPVIISVVMGLMAIAASVICVRFAPAAITATGKIDPGEVVADEFAGQAVTFLVIAFIASQNLSTRQAWLVAGAGFILFRLFDIIKPWPVNVLEKLPAGWGILADDLMAGVYSAVVLIIIVLLFFNK